MKFYSEVTGELYDDINDLEKAEAELRSKNEVEEAKILEILELIDEIADKQAAMSKIAKRIAELTDEAFAMPSITAYPDGAIEMHTMHETITVDKTGKVSTDTKENSIIDDIKDEINEISMSVPSKDKCVHHCNADCGSKKKAKKIDDDVKALLDVLNSLRPF